MITQIECPCGTVIALTDLELQSQTYQCPNCGRQGALTGQKLPRTWIAVLLDVIFPGNGHFYVGAHKAAIVLMVVTLLVILLAMMILVYSDANPFNVFLPIAMVLAIRIYAVVSVFRSARLRVSRQVLPRPLSTSALLAAMVLSLVTQATIVPFMLRYHTYSVPSISMQGTILMGDKILTDLNAYENGSQPDRGHLVVCQSPADLNTTYVKRCVAIGGDLVEMRSKQLFVNGQPEVEVTTIQHSDTQFDSRRDDFGPYLIPDGAIMVLGDERDNSYDSRFFGPVRNEFVLGRAFRIVWSKQISRIGLGIK